MPIICGEFLLQLKSQVEIFQNIFSEIVLSFKFIYFSVRPGRYTLYEQVFGLGQRSLNNEVELDERTWFIRANTNIWDIILG